MFRLLDFPIIFTNPTSPARSTLEKDNIFLHAPGNREQRNKCTISHITIQGLHFFNSDIWLPAGASDVLFGIALININTNQRNVWTTILSGGITKKWQVSLGNLNDIFDIELWTEMAPDAQNNQKAWARFFDPHINSIEERRAHDDEATILKNSLNEKYTHVDPWKYESTVEDKKRRIQFLSTLPTRRYQRVLDIGCGDGFLTFSLPGNSVLGVDLSDKAIEWANNARDIKPDGERFHFTACSIFDLSPDLHGQFDLIIITGVLYPQYIGNSWSLISSIIDKLLLPGGILAACHIHEWTRHRFTYARVHQSWYNYRDYTHCLEVFCK